MEQQHNTNHYETLGINLNGHDPQTVTQEQIREAYKIVNRDIKNTISELAGNENHELQKTQENLEAVKEAKTILIDGADNGLKTKYDAKLKEAIAEASQSATNRFASRHLRDYTEKSSQSR